MHGLGPGRAEGTRPEARSKTAMYNSHVKQQNGQGTSTITGWTGGPNLKGDVRVEIEQRAEAARHGEADPLTEQRMPREHQEHAREYFEQLRKGQ